MANKIINNKKVKEVMDDISKVFRKHKLSLADTDYIIMELVILNKFQLEIAQNKVIKIILNKIATNGRNTKIGLKWKNQRK